MLGNTSRAGLGRPSGGVHQSGTQGKFAVSVRITQIKRIVQPANVSQKTRYLSIVSIAAILGYLQRKITAVSMGILKLVDEDVIAFIRGRKRLVPSHQKRMRGAARGQRETRTGNDT